MSLNLVLIVLALMLVVLVVLLYSNRCVFCETRWHISLKTFGNKSICTSCVPAFLDEQQREEKELQELADAEFMASLEAVIACPVDATNMVKRTTQSCVTIDICPSCQGIWLDHGELDKLTSTAMEESGFSVSAGMEEELSALTEATEGLEPERPCPHDGSMMTKVCCGPVVLDRCPSCKGIWLDHGELESYQAAVGGSSKDDNSIGVGDVIVAGGAVAAVGVTAAALTLLDTSEQKYGKHCRISSTISIVCNLMDALSSMSD